MVFDLIFLRLKPVFFCLASLMLWSQQAVLNFQGEVLENTETLFKLVLKKEYVEN